MTIRTHLSDPAVSLEHSIRCEFRRLVNEGVLRLCDYNDFREACIKEHSVSRAAERIRATVRK
jgi:hypothetical protein